MRKITKIFFAMLLALSLALCSCSQTSTESDDTTVQTGDTTATDTPDVNPAKHEITVSEVEGILAENGLGTNINTWNCGGGVWHGGMQMRVCHTERGTYSVFAKEFGSDDVGGIQKYYVSKVDNDGNSSIVFYGEFNSDDAEVTVNVGQDTNGNIIVTAISEDFHGLYVFDKDTDAVTEYEMYPSFKSESKLGYNQTMFDFENRKVYPFLISGSGTDKETVGDSIIEWYTFDLDTREWSEESVLVRTEDIGRHGYLYPFPDGNGGAYISAIRNEYSIYAEGRFSLSGESYLWDRLGLFYIPDLSTGEGSEYVVVQEEDDSQGLEGIWSHVHHNNYGDVFIDSKGYMHITYRYWLMDYSGEHADFDNQLQYRHAVYKGMECVFNEKLEVPEEDHQYYRPVVRESTDGKLHLILVKMWDPENIKIDFYSAAEELGRSWKHEKRTELDKGVNTDSLTISGVREGSVQDDTLSVFFYGYKGYNSTGYNFNISLKDYSVTELVNILEGFDIQLDWRLDMRVPSSDHQTAIVNTENAVYAAFVYNHNREEYSDYYHIVKIDRDNNVTVLKSDSYDSEQDKYLSMALSDEGKVFVCPPTGTNMYIIDTATDEVTLHEMTPIMSKQYFPRQKDIITDPQTGEKYQVSAVVGDEFKVISNKVNSEKLTIAMKEIVKYTFDRELEGNYDNIYTLSDGNGGAYLVGTRKMTRDDLEGKLDYNGYINEIPDSVMLFYIPNLADGNEIQCIDVMAPYTSQGEDGIWSVALVKDVCLDSEGKLNVIYGSWHFDFDDKDRRGNPELVGETLKYTHAIYEGGKLISSRELSIDGLTKDSSVRMYETEDGEMYFITCNVYNDLANLGHDTRKYGVVPEGSEAIIRVFCESEEGLALAAEKDLGGIVAEGLFISSSRDGSVNDDTVHCLVYGVDREVYYMTIDFEEKK